VTRQTYVAFDGARLHTRISAADASAYERVGFYGATTEQVAADSSQGWNWQVRSVLGPWVLVTKPMADWARGQGQRVRQVRRRGLLRRAA